jgi:hypothetical protein
LTRSARLTHTGQYEDNAAALSGAAGRHFKAEGLTREAMKKKQSRQKLDWQKLRARFPRWLPEDAFKTLVNDAGLPQKVAEMYRAHGLEKLDQFHAHWGGTPPKLLNKFLEGAEFIEVGINEHLAQRFYYAAELVVFQLLSSFQGDPLDRSVISTLVDMFFVKPADNDPPSRDGRGRKAKVTTPRVRAVLREHGKITKERLVQLLYTESEDTRDESVITKWAAKTPWRTWTQARAALLKEIEDENRE